MQPAPWPHCMPATIVELDSSHRVLTAWAATTAGGGLKDVLVREEELYLLDLVEDAGHGVHDLAALAGRLQVTEALGVLGDRRADVALLEELRRLRFLLRPC